MIHHTIFYRANIPAWQTMISTRDAKRRSKREEDRRRRQLEKLPSPNLLWAPQISDRTPLSDHWFQSPCYANHLDDLQKFGAFAHLPRDFFISLEEKDRKTTCNIPPSHGDYRVMSNAQWQSSDEHRVAQEYLEKHKIMPDFFSSIPNSINFCVLHSDDSIHLRNFWNSPHFGNIVDLNHLVSMPKVFINADEGLYTLYIVSPDFPFRTRADDGFMLHGVFANLTCDARVDRNTVVVPYIPPLPTEDAGAYRVLYLLYRQKAQISIPPVSYDWDLEQRRNFRLHIQKPIRFIEENISTAPASIRFLHTFWDIHVQDFYKAQSIKEPLYIPEDTYTELLQYGVRRNPAVIQRRPGP